MRSIQKLFMFICLCIAALHVQIVFCREIAVSDDSLFYKSGNEAYVGKKVTISNISDNPVIIKSIDFTFHGAAKWWWDEETSLPCTLAAEDSLDIVIVAYLPTTYSKQEIWHDSCFIGYDAKICLIRLYIPEDVVPILSDNNENSCYSMKPAIILSDQSSAQARIHYTLMSPGAVQVIIYNVNGKKVRTLVDNFSRPGSYEVIWDYKNSADRILSSGMHYATFTAETKTGITRESIKLPIVK